MKIRKAWGADANAVNLLPKHFQIRQISRYVFDSWRIGDALESRLLQRKWNTFFFFTWESYVSLRRKTLKELRQNEIHFHSREAEQAEENGVDASSSCTVDSKDWRTPPTFELLKHGMVPHDSSSLERERFGSMAQSPCWRRYRCEARRCRAGQGEARKNHQGTLNNRQLLRWTWPLNCSSTAKCVWHCQRAMLMGECCRQSGRQGWTRRAVHATRSTKCSTVSSPGIS